MLDSLLDELGSFWSIMVINPVKRSKFSSLEQEFVWFLGQYSKGPKSFDFALLKPFQSQATKFPLWARACTPTLGAGIDVSHFILIEESLLALC